MQSLKSYYILVLILSMLMSSCSEDEFATLTVLEDAEIEIGTVILLDFERQDTLSGIFSSCASIKPIVSDSLGLNFYFLSLTQIQ